MKERRKSDRRTEENVERVRNISDRAQVMKLVLVMQSVRDLRPRSRYFRS